MLCNRLDRKRKDEGIRKINIKGFAFKETIEVIVCLVWFYGISIIVGYLMPNLVFTFILNIWFVNTFCRYTHLNDQTDLFLTIHFSISQEI